MRTSLCLALLTFLAWPSPAFATPPASRPSTEASTSPKPPPSLSGSSHVSPPSEPSLTAAITWFSGTFHEALEAAKKQGKWLFLDMYADWCFPCKRYDGEVFSQKEVASHLRKHFIAVKRDGTVGEGAVISKRYNCVTYPCILLIDTEGHEVERITQFFEPFPFLQRLREIQAGKDTLASLLLAYQKQPSDLTLRFRIGSRLAYRGDERSVEHLLAVGRNPLPAYPHLAPRALYVLARIYLRNTLRDCKRTLEVAREYLQRYPQGQDLSRIQSLIRWCQRRR